MEVERERTAGGNWLKLPTDLTANILRRLGTLEMWRVHAECASSGGTFARIFSCGALFTWVTFIIHPMITRV